MRETLSLAAIVLAIELAGSTAVATPVLFSNFGACDSFNSGSTWTLLGSPESSPQEVAAPFSPSMSATLTGGDFAVAYFGGGTQVTASVHSDASSLPGSLLTVQLCLHSLLG